MALQSTAGLPDQEAGVQEQNVRCVVAFVGKTSPSHVRCGRNAAVISEHPSVNLTAALKARTIWDLDDRLSRKLCTAVALRAWVGLEVSPGITHLGLSCAVNLPSVEDYYRLSSSGQFMHYVDSPLLCLNALDDPFLG